MAQTSIDFQDIQFKLHNKFQIFGSGAQKLRSNVNLLAVSSTQGLLFAGNPDLPEIKVAIIRQLVDAKQLGQKLQMRAVALPNTPNAIACSADGNMLAINYTLNESGFLQVYCVQSFFTPNIKLLYNIRISPEENVSAIQLLWNPVITSSIAAVLSNGSLALYTLKDGGLYEMHTLDKSLQVKCGCWSPKGKQIVLGFPNGKLQQYKPDLTPAKMIVCPVGVHAGPFDTIAVHWLSTFQFAAVFLQHGDDMAPSLYIVNAPKGGAPSYINYYDICYSATGPRTHQITFTHIQQWNLLLTISANGVEVGILGSKENGETPTWIQYNLLDEARIEMPLTENKDETYPMGFCLDTSSVHSLLVGERQLPVMPMIHVLSTHGHLVSFDFLNLESNVIDICSPHPPLIDSSGQFHPIDDLSIPPAMHEHSTVPQHGFQSIIQAQPPPSFKDKPPQPFAIKSTIPDLQLLQLKVNVPHQDSASALSTSPAKSAVDSSVSFGNIAANSSQFNTTVTTSSFAGFNTNFGNFTTKPIEPNAASTISSVGASQQKQPLGQQQLLSSAPVQIANELTKPLYMVPPTFKPPTPNTSQTPKAQAIPKPPTNLSQPQIDSNEVDDVVKQMIVLQINAFSAELKQLSNQSGELLSSIKNPEEMKDCTVRLNDLQEIIEQANDKEFEADVQGLHHSLNESYAMLTESRSKLEMFKNPNITRLASISSFDPINRRQLAKLQSYLATDQSQLQQLQLQIDSQWSNYQDLLRRNSKSNMHLPSLDGIYQRLTKLKDLIARQRVKLNYIKTKLKQKGLLYKPSINDTGNMQLTNNESIMETISDAILSMSLGRIVDVNRSKLTDEKLRAIRNFSKQQQKITIIKAQRPDRVGLKSEVILETKFQTERKKKESLQKEKWSIKETPPSESSLEKITTTAAQLAKPTATKPATLTQHHQVTFAPLTKSKMSAPSFNFGATSPFVKTLTTSVNSASVAEPTSKPFTIAVPSGAPSFTTPTFTAFGGNVANATSTSFSFTQPKGTIPKPESLLDALSMPPIPIPISFSAKVIGGELAKQPSTLGAMSVPTVPNTSIFTALSTTTLTTSTVKPFTAAENEMEKSEKNLTVDESSEELPPLGSISSLGMPNSSITIESLNASFNRPDNQNFDHVTMGRATQPSAIATSPSTFSFGSEISTSGIPSTLTSNNSNITVSDTTVKSSIFSGFNKPFEDIKAPTVVPVSIIVTDNLNMGPIVSKTSTAVTAFPPNKAIPATAAITSSTSSITTDVTTANPTDTFFESLDICVPNTKDDDKSNIGATAPTGNIFSRFGSEAFSFASAGSNDTSKNLFASSNTTTGNAGNTFSFSSVASGIVKPLTANAASIAQTSSSDVSVSSTTVAESKPVGSTDTAFSFLAGNNALPTTTPSSASASTIFGSVIVTTSTAVPTTTSKSSSIFATSVDTTTTSSSPTASIFGGASTTSPSIFGAKTNAGQISVFAATTAPANSNLFGGIPKPDQSVFSSVPSAPTTQAAPNGSNLFAAATNPLTFSSPVTSTASSGGNIFGSSVAQGGGGSSNFGNSPTAAPSIFGGTSTNVSSTFGSPIPNVQGSSIFGGTPATKSIEGANIFASSAQANNTVGGGSSLFGQNTFGQTAPASGGNIFGSTPSQQQSANTSFGGSSIFGGASNNNVPATGGSIFSGNSPATGPPSFGTFSQSSGPTPAFGSPTGGSLFGQGAASVAQTGFGSPPQTSAFAKPLFGGAPAFGSPPSFGAQPSFGGAATFGFSVPNTAPPTTNAFNPKFEVLGSTDTGLSFGNLAQTTNTNAPKPTFGGSSFMNYRA